MDLRKLKTLIDLVSDSNVSELEITEAEGKVRIVKGSGLAPQHYASAPMVMPTPMMQAPAPEAVVVPAPVVVDTGVTIKSPMVGTFYRSASPGSKSFVEVGDVVKQGDTLCIIEAMKILNEIESDHAGRVRRILVDNGQPVEYGQALFIID
jgi:acetyl-CoA carboxylase biotin carboxyl carrier protein